MYNILLISLIEPERQTVDVFRILVKLFTTREKSISFKKVVISAFISRCVEEHIPRETFYILITAIFLTAKLYNDAQFDFQMLNSSSSTFILVTVLYITFFNAFLFDSVYKSLFVNCMSANIV